MAGYAASARLHGAEPQIAFVGVHAYGSVVPDVDDAGVGSVAAITEHFELVGRPVNDTIADWLASVGESWSQLTFFLFDPESWR